ncbi:MAG: hypothetical protein FWG52_02135 [Proteobacteria bacterium]|nr:hypothetical protein [Pseudomonadota bacterium]
MSTKQSKFTQQPKGCEILKVANIYNIVTELWERAAPGLSEKEIEWFKGGREVAIASVANFANAFESLALSASYDKASGAFADAGNLASLFYVFADYLRGVNALFAVSEYADVRSCLKKKP